VKELVASGCVRIARMLLAPIIITLQLMSARIKRVDALEIPSLAQHILAAQHKIEK